MSVHSAKLHQNRLVLSAHSPRLKGNIGLYPELYSSNPSERCCEQVACITTGIGKLCSENVAVSGVPRNFVRGGGGGQQIQLRTERTAIWGAVAP